MQKLLNVTVVWSQPCYALGSAAVSGPRCNTKIAPVLTQ